MPDFPGDGEGPPPLFDPGPPGPAATVTPTQDAILRYASTNGSVTPLQAGEILHRARGHCGSGAKGGPGDGSACCPYASSDGLEAIKRMIKRRQLIRVAKGIYTPPRGYVTENGGLVSSDPAVAAREEAIDRVDRGMDAEWRERAMAKLRDLCAIRPRQEFTCDALRDLMGDDEPREPRAYGAIMRRGRFEGICEPLNLWLVSDRMSNHKRPERVWISTP